MKRLAIAFAFLIAAATVATLIGVSGAGAGQTPTTSNVRAGLLGSYTTTITGKEHFHVQGANRLTPGTPSTGKWELTLSRTSATLTHLPDRFHATSKVAYGHGRITFAASRGCDVNLSPETTGLYAYRLAGGQLSFREIHDSCVDRAGVLTGEPWHRR